MLVCELVRIGKAVSDDGLVEALEAGESIFSPYRADPCFAAIRKSHQTKSS